VFFTYSPLAGDLLGVFVESHELGGIGQARNDAVVSCKLCEGSGSDGHGGGEDLKVVHLEIGERD
jgi:hypothetical protein